MVWTRRELPDAWPDRASGLRAMIRLTDGFWRHERVELPELPGVYPEYLRKEFHGMPNGYYSRLQAGAYDRGFEISMLGTVQGARERAAAWLADGATCALDMGCGTGRQAQALLEAGVAEVWGLDACPYLLNVATGAFGDVNFVHALAEDSGLDDGQFDAVACCFLFHELPTDIGDRVLDEVHRVLRPGGRVVITEPSPAQLQKRLRRLLRVGPKAAWFGALARIVYEPYVRIWHSRDVPAWLASHGFELVEDHDALPFRVIRARRS